MYTSVVLWPQADINFWRPEAAKVSYTLVICHGYLSKIKKIDMTVKIYYAEGIKGRFKIILSNATYE